MVASEIHNWNGAQISLRERDANRASFGAMARPDVSRIQAKGRQMSEHAPLPPSSAHRWVLCAMSASLEAAYPETEASPQSLEGTAAHWAVQMLLQGTPVAVDTQAPNGVAITLEMLEGAELVRDDIVQTLGSDWATYLVIERRVQIPRVHPDNWGTPDYRAWSRMANGRLCLHIWDFKYGHEIVEAFENWQLIDYTAGALHEAGINGLQDQEVVVDMRVIQPRAYHRDGPVRSWRVVASDLRAYFNRLEMAAEDATSTQPTASPHPDACKNCKGRFACEANQRAAYFAADYGKHYRPLEMSAHAMGLELRELTRARALLDSRVSGLEAQIASRIKSGERVPFWMFESNPGRLAWTKPAAEVVAFGQILGLDLAAEPDVITPTQAKAKAKAAKIAPEIIDAFAARPAGAIKLVQDDGSQARKIFWRSVDETVKSNA